VCPAGRIEDTWDIDGWGNGPAEALPGESLGEGGVLAVAHGSGEVPNFAGQAGRATLTDLNHTGRRQLGLQP